MRLLIIAISYLLIGGLAAQINGYAQISAVSGSTLTVAISNESGAPFLTGKDIVLMQMQDDVIGSNTGNNASFGNLSSIEQAGRYEVRRIVSVARDMFGAPTGLVLDAAPGIGFNTGANSRLQAVTFELLGGGGDHTTTANITALPWNGNVGGVVAFQVQGVLTLAHNISANGSGFRGGERDGTFFSGPPCDGSTFRANSSGVNTNRYATKGEGIYRLTNSAWADGRGKILNGGGGGNMVNAGGGGGGNYTAGGNAVFGWSCGTTHAGGIGGVALTTEIGADRVFLGGGGGGGEGNDNVSTNGGNGGGIILIKANEIRTLGACGQRVISADGDPAANSGNDGAGGGGAGGSIVVDCLVFDLAASCPLLVRSNGGNGGSVNSSTHGGGGGGGQGVVIFSGAIPAANATVNSNNGNGGCNNNSNPCNSQANSGTGSNGLGVIIRAPGPLPIELLSFQAIPSDDRVDVSWSTATELGNDHFRVQRSLDREEWHDIAVLPGAGTSYSTHYYSHSDLAPLPGISYYRLVQEDHDGSTSVSHIVPVRFKGRLDRVSLFPNPASDRVEIRIDGGAVGGTLVLMDAAGRNVMEGIPIEDGVALFQVDQLPAGAYTALVHIDGEQLHQRFVIAR